jgi:hypothetical protein
MAWNLRLYIAPKSFFREVTIRVDTLGWTLPQSMAAHFLRRLGPR